jgi:multiple sugar transport system permease protein
MGPRAHHGPRHVRDLGGVTNLVGEYRVQWNELMAAALIGALPVMLLYAFLNRHLVSAITAGAVKA